MDLTPERMKETYNADLANGLGNLVSRVMKLSEKMEASYTPGPGATLSSVSEEALEKYSLSEALGEIMKRVRQANEDMSREEPWKLVKENQARFDEVMQKLLADIELIAFSLKPFLPETANKIQTALREGKTEPLFQRI